MTLIFPLDVTGAPTVNAAGIVSPTLVTVPTDQPLLADRLYVTPLIVSVLVLGTGTYPNTDSISKFVIGAADVTSPLPLTANFKNVLVPYILLLTGAKVRVTGDPVIPEPVTSPTKDKDAEGTDIVTGVIFVTRPLPSTVTLGTCVEEPYIPGAVLTVANVSTAEPGPVAVPSPVKAEI
jgi:hypothetical protein